MITYVLMELNYRYSNCKQKEFGTIFDTDYSNVSQSPTSLKAKLKSSRKIKKEFDQIWGQVDNLSNSKI